MLQIVVAVYNDGTQLVTQTISSTEICVFLTIFLASAFAVQSGRQAGPGRLKGRPPPGPRGVPIMGHLPLLGTKPFKQLTTWSKTFGKVFKIRMGSRDTIILNGADAIRNALLKQSAVFAGRPDFESFKHTAGGYSVGFSTFTPRWRLQKKISQSAIHAFIANRDHPIEDMVNEQARELTDNLLKSSGTSHDPYPAIAEATSGVVFSICFGRHNRPSKDEVSKQILGTLGDFQKALDAVGIVDMIPWTKSLLKKPFGKLVEVLERFTALVEQKTQEHMVDYDPNVIRDALDAYIKAGDEITEERTRATGLTKTQLINSVQDVIAAGTDSMSRTLQWAVLYMAKFPEVQERVFAEIKDQIGTERQPAYADRDVLPYTVSTLLEVSRHAGVLPMGLPHATTADTQLDGICIPEGTMVFANYDSINRDPDIWGDPEAFRPERFLTADGSTLDQVAADQIIMFGLGKRRCLGEELGKIELFLFFTNLLQRCRLAKPVGHELDIEQGNWVLTWQAKPYEIMVKPRSTG